MLANGGWDGQYGELLPMLANGGWDLIQRLKGQSVVASKHILKTALSNRQNQSFKLPTTAMQHKETKHQVTTYNNF